MVYGSLPKTWVWQYANLYTLHTCRYIIRMYDIPHSTSDVHWKCVWCMVCSMWYSLESRKFKIYRGSVNLVNLSILCKIILKIIDDKPCPILFCRMSRGEHYTNYFFRDLSWNIYIKTLCYLQHIIHPSIQDKQKTTKRNENQILVIVFAFWCGFG